MPRPFYRFSLAALAACLATPAANALEIDDFVSEENDRFANDPAFVMDAYDLSGVARSSDGKWATLVSRTVFASSNHFHPAADGSASITFYQTNDPNGNTVTRTVTDGQRVGSSDLWLGVLDSPVPTGYATYDFATEDIDNATEFSNSVYNDENAYMFGRTGTFNADLNVGVGRNVLDGWLDDVDAAGTTDDALTADDEFVQVQQVMYEALLESGDSGGPLFVDLNNDGNLTLVGTNWILASSGPISDSSGFAYLGNYDQQVQTFIDENPIPEPTSLALLTLGALLTTRRRR